MTASVFECPDCPPTVLKSKGGGGVAYRYRKLVPVTDWDVDNNYGYECFECGHAFFLVKEVVGRERAPEYDLPGRAEMEAEAMKSELAAIAAEEAELAARKERLKK